MGYTAKTEGMEEISKMLTRLDVDAQSVAAQGLYDGAAIMAEAVNQSAGSIRTAKFHYSVFPGATTRLPSPEEKEAVLSAGVGIAKFDKNGSEVNTSIGYGNAGYAEVNGKMKPIAQIANAINSGTSFMPKQPFIRKGGKNGEAKATEAIRNTIENRFKEIIK